MCRVALGKSFLQFSAMKMAHAPPGHHSVIGRPSVGGLSFPEYVVYRGEQVGALYAIHAVFMNICFCDLMLNIHVHVHDCTVLYDNALVLLLQAYPEYLITYQIVKPDEDQSLSLQVSV